MLRLEALPVSPGGLVSFSSAEPEVAIEGRTSDEIDAHLYMIYDSGFAIGPDDRPRMMSGEWMFRRLSPAGHDFIDSVRDPETWKKTKAGAAQAGSWTLGLLAELGKAYAKQKLKSVLGIDL